MYLNARAENREYSQRMGDPGLLKPVIYPAFPLWGAALGAFDLMAASAFLFCLRRTKKPEKRRKEESEKWKRQKIIKIQPVPASGGDLPGCRLYLFVGKRHSSHKDRL